MWKWMKRGALGLAVAGALSFFFFGRDALSYVLSSSRMVRDAVKDSVPVEFEIKRARDLLEELIPETHANLKLVAQEEVEVATLEEEVKREQKSVQDERCRIVTLRENVTTQKVSCQIGSRTFTRAQMIDELARSFEHFRTAEQVIDGQKKLLESRRAALDAAIQKLEKTRLARLDLSAQIESLESQFRLIQAQSHGTGFQVDTSKLAQTQKLLGDLRKRLDVAQRILAREARFTETIPVESVSEDSLLERIDKHFGCVKTPSEKNVAESRVE